MLWTPPRMHDSDREPPTRNVIVCDADGISTRLLARLLAGDGFATTSCLSAAACEDAVASRNPALIVLAILLPDLDGLALVRRLRNRGFLTPILVVSALQAETRALEAGADAFLLKPVTPPRFLQTVH